MSAVQPPGGRNRHVGPKDWANLPRASDHAKLRWLQRARMFDLSVVEAWIEGYPVGMVSHGGSTRLHPPTRTLLTVIDGVITTVLDAHLQRYTADHLLRCHPCGLEFQPRAGDRHCPWCDHNHPKVTSDATKGR